MNNLEPVSLMDGEVVRLFKDDLSGMIKNVY